MKRKIFLTKDLSELLGIDDVILGVRETVSFHFTFWLDLEGDLGKHWHGFESFSCVTGKSRL